MNESAVDWGPNPDAEDVQKRARLQVLRAVNLHTRRCEECPKDIFFARSPSGKKLPFEEAPEDLKLDDQGNLWVPTPFNKLHECDLSDQVEPSPAVLVEGIAISKVDYDSIIEHFPEPKHQRVQLLREARAVAQGECFSRKSELSFAEQLKDWDSNPRYTKVRYAYEDALLAWRPNALDKRTIGFQKDDEREVFPENWMKKR